MRFTATTSRSSIILQLIALVVLQTLGIYCFKGTSQQQQQQQHWRPLSRRAHASAGFSLEPVPISQTDLDEAELDYQLGEDRYENDDELVEYDNSHETVYLLEDKDYPRSLFEDYSRHVGQVSGLATLPAGHVVIFHRADREWTNTTFDGQSMRVRSPAGAAGPQEAHLIRNNTIMILDRDSGGSVASFGSNLFYLPHGIAADRHGNLWLSDVARHQVMRLPSSAVRRATRHLEEVQVARNQSNSSEPPRGAHQIWPDIILGRPFEPGHDELHFCQPTEVAVSSDGRLVFVADGYCNGRVQVFTGDGHYLASLGADQNMSVVHSLALNEARNLICAADRENARILCFTAGLDGHLATLGQFVYGLNYPIGKVYALVALDADHLLVSSRQSSGRYDLSILNPFSQQLKLVWTSSDLLEPHSLARTPDGRHAYAADISQDAYKKVFKFDVIQRRQQDLT